MALHELETVEEITAKYEDLKKKRDKGDITYAMYQRDVEILFKRLLEITLK